MSEFINKQFKLYGLGLILSLFFSCTTTKESTSRFDVQKDLLLAHYDCKTDVDDLHSIAAFRSLLSLSAFKDLNFHVVTGAYGTQEGLYVPPESLLDKAFQTWSDAHTDFEKALNETYTKALVTLENKGSIWIAEAGQSDFSAALVELIRNKHPKIDTKNLIHIVQHSNWNEEVTSEKARNYVRKHTTYHKIPDGNALDNGSPGFRSDKKIALALFLNEELQKIWSEAIDLGNTYNGIDGRYYNESIAKGGLDFSDTAEICYILNLTEIEDSISFFEYLNN
ncbi:MAG: hypothetical protein CMC18_08530 [Flavobacteriaceae bacterium]|nr:hypothetical protein [Flavobacteriaceae bacterium]